MLNDIYNRRILELAADIPHLGRLPEADASATAHSRLCGSTITVDLKMTGDRIADYAQDVKACALGQASSAIMGQNVIGASTEELRQARDELRAMLKEDGPVPGGRFADLAVLQPVKDYKARHASTLLAFDAVVEALDKLSISRDAAE